jgi:hypothetical protein
MLHEGLNTTCRNTAWAREEALGNKERDGKAKVNFALEETIKAEKGRRGVALFFLSTRR